MTPRIWIPPQLVVDALCTNLLVWAVFAVACIVIRVVL